MEDSGDGIRRSVNSIFVLSPRLAASTKHIAVLSLTALFGLSTVQMCAAQQPGGSSSLSYSVAESQSANLPDAPQPQSASPQSNPVPNFSNPTAEGITLAGTPRRILFDQKAIWTSP